mgnify:CR=1 FL=1
MRRRRREAKCLPASIGAETKIEHTVVGANYPVDDGNQKYIQFFLNLMLSKKL